MLSISFYLSPLSPGGWVTSRGEDEQQLGSTSTAMCLLRVKTVVAGASLTRAANAGDAYGQKGFQV